MSKRRIEGSRALVTGASGGIGREIALELAREGADLVVMARRAAPLAELADEVRKLGRRVVTVVGDVADDEVRQAALEAAQQEWGGLDILVNNAGVSSLGRFEQSSPQTLRQIMEVNFFAVVELTRAALPILAEGRRPIVVNVASILAHRGVPRKSEYCASKFALRGWSESLRPELARRGIDLLLVSPGTTDTEIEANLLERHGQIPWRRPRGVPAAAVARATVQAIRRGRHEIIPSRGGWLLTFINRLAPRLVDRFLNRFG